MKESKFKVGQLVYLRAARGILPSSERGYKVVRLLPSEQGQAQYRIKAASEDFERVANESDLTRSK